VYVTLFWLWQTVVAPEIVAAATGKGFTVIANVYRFPSPQELCPFTVIFPETAVDE